MNITFRLEEEYSPFQGGLSSNPAVHGIVYGEMAISAQLARALLQELADWLVFEQCEPVEWVVCGGTALALQGLADRTTKDVDVIGLWDTTLMQVTCIEKFPEKVELCIRRVAEKHPELAEMREAWINLGPRQLAQWGLPQGYEQRLTAIKFNERLTLRLLSRVDLLPLKLYAASDDFGKRQAIHMQDLKMLNPTFDELDSALQWVLKLPNIEQRRSQLQAIVEELGHEELTMYF